MNLKISYRSIILALILAISQVAVASHEAAHFESDFASCELCISQAQPLSATSNFGCSAVLEPGLYHFEYESLPLLITFSPGLVYRQRAPPRIV